MSDDKRTMRDIVVDTMNGTGDREDDIIVKGFPVITPNGVEQRDVRIPRKVVEALASGPSLAEVLESNSMKDLPPGIEPIPFTYASKKPDAPTD